MPRLTRTVHMQRNDRVLLKDKDAMERLLRGEGLLSPQDAALVVHGGSKRPSLLSVCESLHSEGGLYDEDDEQVRIKLRIRVAATVHDTTASVLACELSLHDVYETCWRPWGSTCLDCQGHQHVWERPMIKHVGALGARATKEDHLIRVYSLNLRNRPRRL